jgi:molybdopterin-guanine dinucleotide biosynthesis protein B
MIPIISIVGKSGSGKTTLIEKLLPEFTRRGYRIGTVKHHLHDFDVDKEGKDSWRHARAGAKTVVISSPHKLAMVKKTASDISLEEMHDKLFYDVDIVIAEGYKTSHHLKVEVFRSAVHAKPLFTNNERLLAIVSDTSIDTDIPCFGLEEIVPLVDFLENTLLRKHPLPEEGHSNSQV